MYYRVQDGHGLPHNPIKAIVAPRPIAWIGTQGQTGDNLAPFSFFTLISETQIMISFSADTRPEGKKDTLTNIEATGIFSVSLCSASDVNAVAQSAASAPAEIDEFVWAGVEKANCKSIDAPHVKNAPAVLECTLDEKIQLKTYTLIIGEILGVYIDDQFLEDGLYQSAKVQPLARLGYFDYGTINMTEAHRTPPFHKK